MSDDVWIGGHLVRYEREATDRAYQSIEIGGAEECGCGNCLNFISQRAAVYPPAFSRLLDQLGIDFNKDGEVYEICPLEPGVTNFAAGDEGKHLYGGWFFFKGDLLTDDGQRVYDPSNGVEYWLETGPTWTVLTQRLDIGFHGESTVDPRGQHWLISMPLSAILKSPL